VEEEEENGGWETAGLSGVSGEVVEAQHRGREKKKKDVGRRELVVVL
jgi:acetylglutamate kinase